MAADSTADERPLFDLTAFQRDLLAAIARYEGDAELSGLELKRELEPFYDKEIHHGRLYPNLDELVRKGFVEKSAVDDRTNEYHLTARGQREMAADHAWRTGS